MAKYGKDKDTTHGKVTTRTMLKLSYCPYCQNKIPNGPVKAIHWALVDEGLLLFCCRICARKYVSHGGPA